MAGVAGARLICEDTAHIRDADGWCSYDDSRVFRIREHELDVSTREGCLLTWAQMRAAYILFYRRACGGTAAPLDREHI